MRLRFCTSDLSWEWAAIFRFGYTFFGTGAEWTFNDCIYSELEASSFWICISFECMSAYVYM